MSTKSLYEEAIADARQVRELAVRDASRSVMETLTPRIRKLVEEQLLGDSSVEGPPRLPRDQDELSSQDNSPVNVTDVIDDVDCVDVVDPCDDVVTDPRAMPPAGFVRTPEIAQYELNIEGVSALQPLLKATKSGASKEIELATFKLGESINKMKVTNPDLRATKSFNVKLTRMIEGMENMYDYVQEVITDPALKSTLSERLETHYQDLEQLREDTMKNRNRRRIREADEELDLDVGGDDDVADSGGNTTKVSLNVNVPAELADDLVDALGEIEVELDEKGASDDSALDDSDLDVGDDEGGDDMDADDLDAGADDLDVGADDSDDSDDSELQLNSRKLSDDTIVEIDEAMLRRELKRMRLSEEGFPTPSADGAGVGAEEMDDFGGGSDEGEPFSDLDVESDWPGARNAAPTRESLTKKLKFEERVQAAAKSKGAALRREGAKARAAGRTNRLSMIETKFKTQRRIFNESVARTQTLKGKLNEATKTRSNSGVNADENLRKKLAESNLDNAKLQLANKLLQTNIPNKKKLQIVEALDGAKTVREAQLIYKSSVSLVTEGTTTQGDTPRRGNPGSASRPTRSGSATTQTLNEGFEMNRWQRLAGLK